MTNFFYFILQALQAIIQLVIVPLFGGASAYHQATGLSNMIGANALVVLKVAFSALGNFDLTILGICIPLTIGGYVIGLAVNIYLKIKSMIPVVG